MVVVAVMITTVVLIILVVVVNIIPHANPYLSPAYYYYYYYYYFSYFYRSDYYYCYPYTRAGALSRSVLNPYTRVVTLFFFGPSVTRGKGHFPGQRRTPTRRMRHFFQALYAGSL